MTQEDVDRIKNQEFLTAQRKKAEAEEAANKPAPAPAENLHAEEETVTPPATAPAEGEQAPASN